MQLHSALRSCSQATGTATSQCTMQRRLIITHQQIFIQLMLVVARYGRMPRMISSATLLLTAGHAFAKARTEYSLQYRGVLVYCSM